MSFALGLTFSYLAVTAICLALMDLHPIKRIILFAIVPTLLFGSLTLAGVWIANQPFGLDFDETVRFCFDMAFVCMSVAWLFWFCRIHRGWQITRRATDHIQEMALTFGSKASTSKPTEIIWLLTCLALTALINQCLAGEEAFIIFPVGGLIALFFLLPVTYFAMRTKHPIIAWVGLSLGVPMVASLIFITAQFSFFSRPGILITDEAKAFFLTLLLACVIPVTFLLALRMVGYRLEVSQPWQQKIKPDQPRPHPLDE
jgi:hypothetical protein